MIIFNRQPCKERRLKKRINANRGLREPTNRLKVFTHEDKWPRIGSGCIDSIRRQLDALNDPRLLIVDTMARVRPENSTNKDRYTVDYSDVSKIHGLTADYPMIAIVIIGHTRKAVADDVFDQISGTQGISGAVDTMAVFAGLRGTGKAKFYVDGRDVMGVRKSAVYDKSSWTWVITGDIAEVETTENQDKIFNTLKKHGGQDGIPPADIVALSGVHKETVRKTLYAWVEFGIVERTTGYRYVLSSVAIQAGSMSNMILANIEDPTIDRY